MKCRLFYAVGKGIASDIIPLILNWYYVVVHYAKVLIHPNSTAYQTILESPEK